MRLPWQKEPEPRVRLSDVALLADSFKGIFEAGVAANKVEMPAQIMLTPEQLVEERAEMKQAAGWIATGGSREEDD